MRPRARARVVERRRAEADDGCSVAFDFIDDADSFVDILNRFTANTEDTFTTYTKLCDCDCDYKRQTTPFQ